MVRLAERHGGKVLLLLDEVQSLADLPSGNAMIASLRAVLHKRRNEAGAVFTGSSQEGLARLTNTVGAPMYQFAQLLDFPFLGDEFLQIVAKKLEQCVRGSDTIARIDIDTAVPRLSRLGGDEFAVLLVEVDKTDRVMEIARRFLEMMAAAFHIGGHEVFMTGSIGISVFPDDGMDRDTLVQRAAVALKFAKQQGGNTYCFYSSD